MSIDPRAWNIVTGVCVATGCGSRLIAADEGGTGETTVGTAESGPECKTTQDCPYGYYCYGGVCQYGGYSDGHLDHTEDYWYGDCYSDYDCPTFSLCDFNYCNTLWTPPSCPGVGALMNVPVPDIALAIAFVDADADGAEELAVATPNDIQLFESAGAMPITSPRNMGSAYVQAMAAGDFDANPGEDLVLLVDDQLYTHLAFGGGLFDIPTETSPGWPMTTGMAAGMFDPSPVADILLWGESGATVVYDNGPSQILNEQPVHAASARSLTEPVPGYVLQSGSALWFHGLDGLFLSSADVRGSEPVALTSFAELGDGYDLSSCSIAGLGVMWSLLDEWGPGTGNMGQQWAVAGTVRQMIAGDFDGDMRADLALVSSNSGTDTVAIAFGIHDLGCMSEYLSGAIVREIAAGDLDGDGDLELAVRQSTGEVVLIDGE